MIFCRCVYQYIIIASSALLLSSCMVGPDFHAPSSPHTKSYLRSPIASRTVKASQHEWGQSQHFRGHANIPEDWYKLFGSEALNHLIQLALYNSPNLAAAKATLLEAQANYDAQIGGTLYPAINLRGGGEREKAASFSVGKKSIPIIFNVFNFGLNASYTLDFFGGLRRQIEALGAQMDFAHYELEVAYLTLSANVVTTAIAIASFSEQINITKTLIREQRKQLNIIKAQYRLGGISLINVLNQRTLVAQTEATLPPLRQSLAQNRHALAVLIGFLPSDIDLPHFDFNRLRLPLNLPTSIPSELVRHRPDIRAAEALIHVASANIGVATANLFPQFSLSANYGWIAGAPGALFKKNTNAWLWGGSFTAPLFNGGALLAQRRAAMFAYQAAFAQYRQTVLQAFQGVANTLRAITHDAQTLQKTIQAEKSAREALNLAEKQYHLGGINYLSLLVTTLQYQQARIARVQAETSRYIDTAALFQTLGGGWWNRASLDCSCELSQNLEQYKLGGKMR